MLIPSTTSPRSAIRRLAAARFISEAGTEAAFIALLFGLYRQTGSARWVSVALLATFGVRGLAAPFAGALGDRFDRRRVMILSDSLGVVCFASLAFVSAPIALVGLAFLAALVGSPFYSAVTAAVPNLVGEGDLSWANGTIASTAGVAYLIGPAIGGALVAAIGVPAVFLLNASSFLGSALLVSSISGRFVDDRPVSHRDRGLREGFAFIAGDRVLRALTISFCVCLLAVGSVVVADLPLSRSFGMGAFGYSLMGASWGAGGIIGALLARRLKPHAERTALMVCSFVSAATIGAVSLMPAFAPILAMLLVGATSDAVFDVVTDLWFQRRTPDAVRSRVLAAFEGVALLAFAGAFLIAGVLVQALGPRGAYAVAGAGWGFAALILTSALSMGDRRPARAPAQELHTALPVPTEDWS